MDGVDAAFEALQPVALLDDLGQRPPLGRCLRPGKQRRRRLQLRRPHVGPDDAARLMGRVGRDAHAVLEVAEAGSDGMSTHWPVESNFQPW